MGKTENELRAALKEFIESVEEQNLLLAEMLVRFGEQEVLNEDFETLSGHTFREFLLLYEKQCKDARAKWNLPCGVGPR